MLKQKNIFKTKRGLVSAYGLACGYLQNFNANNLTIELSQEAGCQVYHVKIFNNLTCTRIEWLSFDSLKEARGQFAFLKRNIKKELS
jgi:hypothetical protein